MKHITVEDILEGTGGALLLGHKEQEISHISLDSRSMKDSDLFVPIVGEKVDAHRFLCQAIKNGAKAVFTSAHRTKEEVKEVIVTQAGEDGALREACLNTAWIYVEDTRDALQALGSYIREGLSLPLVGITGSVGKTTTREMIASALSAGRSVYKTPGNSNSQVGVPITLSEIPDTAEIGVIELGMSEPGEMTRIAGIARVDSAVITNIGVTHIEQLGSQENILKEKLHIQDGMKEDGVLFLNGDDPLLLRTASEVSRKVITFGLSEGCDYRAEELYREEGYPVFTMVHGDDRIKVRLKVVGNHMVSNALAALAVADYYQVPLEAAGKALEQFEGYKGRQQIFEKNGIRIIDDSYNASPVSMKAGLQVLSAAAEAGAVRTIAVLADMKELGPESPLFHREIGSYIGSHPVTCTVLLGSLAREIGEGIKESGAVEKGLTKPPVYCDTLDEVKAWLDQELREGDCVLFKGSNSMRLSEAVAYLKDK